MSNNFYNSTFTAAIGTLARSSTLRAQFALVEDGFGKLPSLSGNAYKIPFVNGTATGLTTGASLYTDGSGNFGVGTSTPQAKFVVSNAGASGVEIAPTGGIGGPAISSYNRSGAVYTPLMVYALNHIWWSGAAGRAMDLDTNGYLGIGTSTPQQRLHVAGIARFDGGNANRPVTINNSIWCRGEAGSWSMGYRFLGNSGTELGGFGALGTADALNYLWLGSDFSNAALLVKPTGGVLFVPRGAPTGPGEGEVYYDSATKKHYGWNGTAWMAFY